ncbi:MAG: HNH endonuclease [Syntrophobacteraceae bacterium]
MQAENQDITITPEIPFGFCHCGCRQKTKISPRTDNKKGWIRGQPRRFLHGHHLGSPHGELNPSWKGGSRVDSQGYKEILLREHSRAQSNGYVGEHILVAEKVLGKPLPERAQVHHHNGDKTDNYGNLVICQDDAYHKLIERRTKAYFACGHADWRKCQFCKRYDDPENLKQYGKHSMHSECCNKYQREYYFRKRTEKT